MQLIGTTHTPMDYDATLEAMDNAIASVKGKKEIVVGFELTPRTLKTDKFFGELAGLLLSVNKSRGNDSTKPRIRIAYLDSTAATTRVESLSKQKGTLTKETLTKGILTSATPTNSLKQRYINVISRTKFMESQIRLQKPDVVIVGSGHAVILEKRLKIKANFVGIGKEEVRKKLKTEFTLAYQLKRKRNQLKRIKVNRFRKR